MEAFDESNQPAGFLGSIRRLMHHGVDAIHVRTELFALEMREEAARFVQLIASITAFIFLAAIALLVISFTVVFAVWNDPVERMHALWTLCGLYTLGAILAGLAVCRLTKAARKPFEATLRELEKDKSWIGAQH